MKYAKTKAGKASSHTIHGSHSADFRAEQASKMLFSISDLKLALGDNVMDELEEIDHNQARMLERGTGKLRKCSVCGDVYVNNFKSEMKFKYLFNKGGYKCFFCFSGTRDRRRETKKFKRKREILRKVYELYLERLNTGVTITKII